MMAGARALRASIFDHVLDSEVLSAILAINYKMVTLRDYLSYGQHREAVLRVSQERRNLLPLLPYIDKAYWVRKDLFSRKLWVRDGRKRTVVDYSRFSTARNATFHSLESRSAFRWLCKAQLTVVKCWASADGGQKNVDVLENLAKANISARIPAIAWCHLVNIGPRVIQLGVGEVAQRLYRVFAAHCAQLWEDQGFIAVKLWLRSEHANLADIVDWLIAEGIAQGYPGKNATWVSLLRRCADWHDRTALEHIERSTHVNLTWTSLVPETEVDGLILTPLNSTKEVALEGYRQHHCVGGYADNCAEGRYRVYAVLEPDGTRSTLGLWLGGGKRWVIEQHRGKYNGLVSEAAAKAGKRMLELYQQAHRALAKRKA